MADETESGQGVVAAPKKGLLHRVRNSWPVRIARKSLDKSSRPFLGEEGTARAALTTSVISAVAVMLLAYQNWYQEKASDRVWSAQQIAVIYDEDCSFKPDGMPLPCQPKASQRSRENAVRAYVDVEGHEGAARLPDSNLAGMSFAGVDFSYVDFSGTVFDNTILTDTSLRGATLVGAVLQQATLIDADLRDANMAGAYLEGANLKNADLRGARLDRAVFGSCDDPVIDYGSNVSYTAANLAGADLSGAVLTGASLCEVDLSGADLTNVVGIDNADLERARGDEETKLPRGMTRPKRWFKGNGASSSKKTGP